jgi:hypothetical protein
MISFERKLIKSRTLAGLLNSKNFFGLNPGLQFEREGKEGMVEGGMRYRVSVSKWKIA